MRYAGFWSRFGAMLLDSLLLVPVILGVSYLASHSKLWMIIISVALAPLGAAYHIYFHGRWGQTVGKMATGIKVVALDGSPIGWPRAFVRHSVDIGLALLATITGLIALGEIPAADFATMDLMALGNRMNQLKPAGFGWVDWVQTTWFWSELVILLLNKERRALHDFIAGTVVVHVEK